MIAIISCKKLKQTYPCQVREMYSKSPLFRSQLEFCELVNEYPIVNFGTAYQVMMKYAGLGDYKVFHVKGWHLDPTLEFYQVNGKWRLKK